MCVGGVGGVGGREGGGGGVIFVSAPYAGKRENWFGPFLCEPKSHLKFIIDGFIFIFSLHCWFRFISVEKKKKILAHSMQNCRKHLLMRRILSAVCTKFMILYVYSLYL